MTATEADYEEWLLKPYRWQNIYLHHNQAYLGRCYIALNRPGNVDPFLETTAAEKEELNKICADIYAVLQELYKPNLLNYANFRNTWHHCHWHVIPRYDSSRVVSGQEFTDKNWGRNYAPYNTSIQIPHEVFLTIKQAISAGLKAKSDS